MKRVCLVTLILATVGTGLMAGLALTYAVAVMPGLANTGDRTFVDAFQQIDRALDSTIWFWVAIFVGSMVSIILSTVFVFKLNERSIFIWLILVAILYGATIAITAVGLDPLEYDFGRGGGPSEVLDASAMRADLNEDRWALLNGIRLVTNVIAVACLAWSLVLFGRSTSETHEEES